MNTKLTLTMDKSVIETAKKYARSQERSLSNLVENYLKMIVREEKVKANDDEELSPIVKSLMGSFSVPEDFDYDYKRERLKRLEKKYL